MRITAQLIDTRDGYHIFSKVYDRVLEDIFKTQDEISLEIVERAAGHAAGQWRQGSLSSRPRRRTPRRTTPTSRDCTAGISGPPTPRSQAVDHFQHGVDLDPEFAQAWAAMARTHTYLAAIGRLTACGEAYGCASDAAGKAIELDPDLEDSHVALALVRLFHDWDPPACEASFLRAMSINPDSVEVLHGYSLYFTAAGRHEEAVTVLEKAATIDPLNLPVRDHLARAYMATERFDEALAQFDRVMELDPEFRAALEGKGFTYMVMDRLDDALATFEQVRELTPHPKGGITPLAIALALAGRTTEAGSY